MSFVRPGRLLLGSIPSLLQDIPTILCMLICENEDQDLLICCIFSFELENQRDVTSFIMFGSKVQRLLHNILIGFNMLEFIQKFQLHLPLQK